MFLASVAHLLPSDIQISNRQQQELALNFSAAYYAALSGKCWPERATSWSSYSFRQGNSVDRQTILYQKSHKFDSWQQWSILRSFKLIWIHAGKILSIWDLHLIVTTEQNFDRNLLLAFRISNHHLTKTHLEVISVAVGKNSHTAQPRQPVVTDGYSPAYSRLTPDISKHSPALSVFEWDAEPKPTPETTYLLCDWLWTLAAMYEVKMKISPQQSFHYKPTLA